MRRFSGVLATGVLLAAAGSAWLFLRDTEEKKIRLCVDRLCRVVEFREKENPALAALRLNGMDEIFCDPVLLEFRHNHWNDRFVRPSELSARIAAAHRMLHALDLQISDLRITVANDRADLLFTAELKGSSRSGKENFQEVRDIAAVMLRKDGRWKFQEMRVHDVLEH